MPPLTASIILESFFFKKPIPTKKERGGVVYQTFHSRIITITFFVAVTGGDGGQVAVTVTVLGKGKNGLANPITILEETVTDPPGGITGIVPLFGPERMNPGLEMVK